MYSTKDSSTIFCKANVCINDYDKFEYLTLIPPNGKDINVLKNIKKYRIKSINSLRQKMTIWKFMMIGS